MYYSGFIGCIEICVDPDPDLELHRFQKRSIMGSALQGLRARSILTLGMLYFGITLYISGILLLVK